jgi:hypothetical protein
MSAAAVFCQRTVSKCGDAAAVALPLKKNLTEYQP